MSAEHQPAVPIAIEQVVTRLDELVIVLGEPARAVIPIVRTRLIEAMAARDRNDPPAALRLIGQAMDALAGLADSLGPDEASLMRAVAARFRTALGSHDQSTAHEAAALMFEKSGARERK